MGSMARTYGRNWHLVKSSSMVKSRTSVAELLLELDGSGPLTGRLERALRAAVREGRVPAGPPRARGGLPRGAAGAGGAARRGRAPTRGTARGRARAAAALQPSPRPRRL